MVKYLWKIAVIAVLLALMLVFVPAPYTIYDAYAEVVELPIDLKSGGLAFDWANYTSSNHYEDPSITVDIVEGGRIYDTEYMYALIRIQNPTQLRTAFTDDTFNGNSTALGTSLAKKKRAVFAMNGDYCKVKTTPDGKKVNERANGYIVRMDHTIREKPDQNWDLLIIDQNGDFHTIIEPTWDKLNAWIAEHPDLRMVNTFNFGPALIVDGETTRETFNNKETNKNTDWIGTYKATQRTCICQLDALTYLAVYCEGPEQKNSKGLTMDQFVECLRQVEQELEGYTIRTAYNLDGGSSSTFVFKDEKKNDWVKINAFGDSKKRPLYDIIYFASAWKE